MYFGCDDGMMYALDEMNGAVVWSYNAFSPIRSSKVPWCKLGPLGAKGALTQFCCIQLKFLGDPFELD